MKIRPLLIDDIGEVTAMFIALIQIVYPKHQKGLYDTFLHVVQSWVINKRDIFIAEHEGELVGFSLSYVIEEKILEPYYQGDLLYIKPKFRKSKASYLLYANMLNISNNLKMPIHAKGYTQNDAGKILAKFGEPTFVEFIKV